jgi:hypothetical protein
MNPNEQKEYGGLVSSLVDCAVTPCREVTRAHLSKLRVLLLVSHSWRIPYFALADNGCVHLEGGAKFLAPTASALGVDGSVKKKIEFLVSFRAPHYPSSGEYPLASATAFSSSISLCSSGLLLLHRVPLRGRRLRLHTQLKRQLLRQQESRRKHQRCCRPVVDLQRLAAESVQSQRAH